MLGSSMQRPRLRRVCQLLLTSNYSFVVGKQMFEVVLQHSPGELVVGCNFFDEGFKVLSRQTVASSG